MDLGKLEAFLADLDRSGSEQLTAVDYDDAEVQLKKLAEAILADLHAETAAREQQFQRLESLLLGIVTWQRAPKDIIRDADGHAINAIPKGLTASI